MLMQVKIKSFAGTSNAFLRYKKGLPVFVFLQTAGGKLTDSPWSVLFYLSLSILERLLSRAVVNQSMSSLWNTSGGLIFKTFP